MTHRTQVLVAMLLITGCVAPPGTPDAAPHEKLDAVLWMGTAAERAALTEQSFRLARLRLDQQLQPAHAGESAALEQPTPGALPPALIVDVDETVLDNGVFEAELVQRGGLFDPEHWRSWVERRAAVPIPGALGFCRYADSIGVRVFYVTNRSHDIEDATRDNLAAQGFPVDADGANILSLEEKGDWEADKTPRRAFIARTHRIVLIVGDDLGDFVGGSDDDPASRVRLAHRHAERFGNQWIVLPNPVYGAWERALYGFDETASEREVLRRKRRALDDVPLAWPPAR